MTIRLTTLGSTAVLGAGGGDVVAQQPLRFALVTYIALEGSRSRRDVLSKFWGDSDEERARSTLNQTVYQLRRALGADALRSDKGLLVAEGFEVDVNVFGALADQGDHAAALALYLGHFLDTHGAVGTWEFQEWVDRTRSAARQTFHDACVAHARSLADRDAWGDLLSHSRRWIALEPLVDQPRFELIRALAEQGQRRAALDEYERYARFLRQELEVDPGSDFQEVIALVRSGALPTRSTSGFESGVPDSDAAEDEGSNDKQVTIPVAEAKGGHLVPGQIHRRWTSRTVAALVLLGVTLGAAVALVAGSFNPEERPPTTEYPLSNVAVAAFESTSADAASDYLGTAVTSALVNQLSQARILSVSSTSATRLFQDATIDLDSLRRILKIGSLVEGRIDRADGRIRVDVRLVDALTGETLSSRTLERDSTAVFALIDETVREVARFLRDALNSEVLLRRYDAGTSSVEAWHAVLTARQQRERLAGVVRARTPSEALEALERADSLLHRAARLDRDWAVPHLELARNAIARSQLRRLLELDLRRASASAVEAVSYSNHALLLGTDSAEALRTSAQALSEVARFVTADSTSRLIEEAGRRLEESTRLEPDAAAAWIELARWYADRGRHADASRAGARAYELDGLHPSASALLYQLFEADFQLDRDQSAESWCAEGRRRFPIEPPFVYCALVLEAWGDDHPPDLARARALLDSLPSLQLRPQPHLAGRLRMLVAAAYARAGQAAAALAHADSARAVGAEDPALLWMEATVRHGVGDLTATRELLHRFRLARPDEAARIARSRPIATWTQLDPAPP